MASRIFHSQMRKEKIMSNFLRNEYEYLRSLRNRFIRGVFNVHEQEAEHSILSEKDPENGELPLVYTWVLSNLAIHTITKKRVGFWFTVFSRGMCTNSAFLQAGAEFYYPYFAKSKDELMNVVYQCLSDMKKKIPELEYTHTHSTDENDSFCINLRSVD